MTRLEPDDWRRLLEATDSVPTASELARTLADADVFPHDDAAAYAAVESALDAGVLTATETDAAFPELRLATPTARASDDHHQPDTCTSDGSPDRTVPTPGYADLYLEARARSDADSALVPHEDIVAVFEAHGWDDVVTHLRTLEEWIVWTPDDRETPLYAYTPDLAGDTTTERERLAELLEAADVGTERFIDVHDGQKGSFDTGNARPPDDPAISGNYGVKGGRGGDPDGRWLVDIDVDDYDEAKTATDRIETLREETLAVASAHTTVDQPGHLYVAVDGDPTAVVRELTGRDQANLTASFGEIRVEQQYVVGPGSEILCDCERCSDADAPEEYGRYELATARPPVVWDEDEFREFLLADRVISDVQRAPHTDGDDNADRPTPTPRDDEDGRVTFARRVDDGLADAIRAARGAPEDRSQVDARLAAALVRWIGTDETAIRRALNDVGTSKWQARGDSYRDSIVDWAIDRAGTTYDTIPYWAVVAFAIDDGIVTPEDVVRRDADSGAVAADPDAHDGDTYRALPDQETYAATLDAIEALGVDHGRDRPTTDADDEPAIDPTTIDVTLEPGEAWRAARAVGPDDLTAPLGLPTHPDHRDPDGGWTCPHCDGAVDDVARAVALDQGRIDACDAPLDSTTYDAAYRRARDEHGAPLPEYVSAGMATDDLELAYGAVSALRGWHILDALESTVTDPDPSGDAVAVLDPTWEDSESGERIVCFDSGLFYCREHETVIDPLRAVALEQELIDAEDARLAGDTFLTAYALARREYDAPLPELTWNDPDDAPAPEHVPVLPPAEDLLGEVATDADGLDAAREDVEELYRDLADRTSQAAHLMTVLPALGKTTSAIKAAADHPTLYVAPRKELMQEAATKAEQFGCSSMHLPILAEERPRERAVEAGTELVREHGRSLLRQPETLLERIDVDPFPAEATDDQGGTDEPHCPDCGTTFETVTAARTHDCPADDDVDLDRECCPTADGGDDPALTLAVHVARELGHTPRELHVNDEAIFDRTLPCHADGECPYSAAYRRARDPDAPIDLLVGHYMHAHVPGVRTYRERIDDRIASEPRVVAVDEFPDDIYAESFGEEFLDHARWLAGALRADVDDRTDLLERRPDLWADPWLQAWLAGEASPPALATIRALSYAREAFVGAESALQRLDDEGEGHEDVRAALTRVRDLHPTWDVDAIQDALARLDAVIGDRDSPSVTALLDEDVIEPLAAAFDQWDGDEPPAQLIDLTDAERMGDELRGLVGRAVDTFRETPSEADDLLEATETALVGGPEAAETLAAGAEDGYAHPDAFWLLRGVLAPAGNPDALEDIGGPTVTADATIVETDAFDFTSDHGDGTRIKQVDCGRVTILVDRNHEGATVLDPPAFGDGRGSNPVIGLDATGREALWELALGRRFETRDIHETPADRRAFLQDTLPVQVVQTTPHINSYEGNPAGKNFDGDVALVEAVADQFGGDQLRQDRIAATSRPGVITTKTVREAISDRLGPHAGAIDHYGNVTGSNDLADCNLGVVLGTRHFGDDAVEKWAAYAGETVTREGHGHDLNYGSPVANTYLKHMREDQTFQAILRFGRDESGAVVFAHTAALREDLPVVGEGAVVEAFSKGAKTVASAMQDSVDESFTVGDVVDQPGVKIGRRQVRRVLNEFTDLGYLEKREAGPGLANRYDLQDQPGTGSVQFPDGVEPPGNRPAGLSRGAPPGQSDSRVSNTEFVWVARLETRVTPRSPAQNSTLPTPPAERASNGGDQGHDAGT